MKRSAQPERGNAVQDGRTTKTEERSGRSSFSGDYAISEDTADFYGDTTREQSTRSAKAARQFKERGSIAARITRSVTTPMIPSHSRVKSNQTYKPKGREKKTRHDKLKVYREVYLPTTISVGNLARLLHIRLERLQRKMEAHDMGRLSSYDHILDQELATFLALEFDYNPIVDDEIAFDIYPPPAATDRANLPPRPPVVTIMGHVDHGKTTLLDTLRSTSVAKGEAGGITQHIGAFSVPVPTSSDDPKTTKTITFLDTPGHAAFSAMRARGASVTDIIVLVVAADDGIMPQTREVLDLVKKDAGKVGLVVAVNKIDKPSADTSKVETALFAEGVQLECFGGDIPSVHVSGLTGQGLPELVETISILSEMQDVRAETDGQVQGYVLESKVSKGMGPVATVLVLRGQLTPGTHLIAGTAHGKVRVLKSPSGSSVKAVLPGTAAVVSGWKELPKAGDEVLSGSEGDVKKALTNRLRNAEKAAMMEDVEILNQRRLEEREQAEALMNSETIPEVEPQKEEKKELRIVLKGDVSGSVEAVEGALQGIGNHIAGVKIVSTGVGDVSESDVLLAKAVDGIVVAFSVNIPRSIEALAVEKGVSSLKSSIIYELMDLVKARVIDLLPKVVEKKITGEADVLQLFEISLKAKKTMKVAGCRIINGIIEKNKMARVIRNGESVYEGKLETLRHLKKDIMEAGKGLECGMAFAGWDDLREGDLVQSYQEIEKPASL
ncbi:hypothetical protein NM688_g8302 [Phlebia brevispora]|uniref:Uncharacterized protein n=1 Tax=Phlebia brevispora TaxID=194682 RepID=A0ACC1RTY3_9APHY|nr:hypothetical protein NM688_g8302 [Phlebia brevispora]